MAGVEGLGPPRGQAGVEERVHRVRLDDPGEVGDDDRGGCRLGGGRRLDAERDDVVDRGAGLDLGARGGVGADDEARHDGGVEGLGLHPGDEAGVEERVHRVRLDDPGEVGDDDRGGCRLGGGRRLDAERDDVVDRGAGLDLGARGGVGAHDGTRDHLSVEGFGAHAGQEIGIQDRVEATRLVESKDIRHCNGRWRGHRGQGR